MPESFTGRLLVATPMLNDPNFERTVVLILEHNEEGAVGLVLNRPSELELLGWAESWNKLAATPDVVFVGGPVTQSIIALARRSGLGSNDETLEGDARLARGLRSDSDASGDSGDPDDEPPRPSWTPIVAGIGVVDLAQVEPDNCDLETVRVFMGYAGWSTDQLEAEVKEGAWFVVDCLPGDPLTIDPDNLWATVLRRQPEPLNWFALYPPDPSMN